MMRFRLSALLSVVTFGTCSLSRTAHPVPQSWNQIARAPSDHIINIHIALKQHRFDELDRVLLQVSDPYSPRYGLHLSASEVEELIKPHDHVLETVHSWLREHGINLDLLKYSPSRDWISFGISVDAAERLLQTSYFVFEHEEGGRAIRAPSWSLPEHLHDMIEDIQPTTSFFRARAAEKPRARVSDPKHSMSIRRDVEAKVHANPGALSGVCNASAITPTCIRTLYGMIDYEPQRPPTNRMALVNFLGEFNNRSDIDIFLKAYRPDAAAAGAAYDFTDVSIAGGINHQEPATTRQGREGNLDAQVMLGIAFPTPLVTYTTGEIHPPFQADIFTPNNTNEPFLTWLQYMLAQPDPLPQVVSISYGDIEQTIPLAYAQRVCRSFAQLGARGVSVIFGAGDSGVGKAGACVANDGSERRRFLSVFPEACPYGTSVGATRYFDPEEVVADDERKHFVSGGGFSSYFPRPGWQDAAVGAYLGRLGARHEGMFEAGGRGYPDVAAQGCRTVTVWNDTVSEVDGTSVSAPTFAAVVALVNDALLAEGRPPLGFLNPWLYAVAGGSAAFTDVLHGSNRGCGTSGFPAMRGWDAASGFGTPWFPELKRLAMQNKFRGQRPWYIPT